MLHLLLALSVSAGQTAALGAARPRETAPRGAVGEAYYEFLHARRLEGEGEIEAAVAALRRAAALDPGSADIHAEMASLLARQNRADDAVAAAERALALDPNNSEANWVLGMIYAALARTSPERPGNANDDRAARAITHLEKAAPRRPWDAGLYLTLGRLYLQVGANDKAIERLSGLVNRDSGVADAALLLAEAYESADQREQALTTLDTVPEDDPLFARAQELKAGLSERKGDFNAAADAYARALAINPAAEELRVRRASALLQAGRTSEAREALDRLLREDPKDAQALYLLVQAQQQGGDLEAAEATARRLIELEPKSVRSALGLAQVHEARRDFSQVVATLAPIVEGSEAGRSPGPAMTNAMLRLAYAKQQTGETAAAVALFEEVRRRATPTAVTEAYLIQALIAARAYQRAVDVAEAARARWPEDIRLIRLQAEALTRVGQHARAAALLEERASKQPADPSHVVALAAVLAEGKQFDRAVSVLEDAAARFPRDAALSFQLGAVYEQAGDTGRAERAFRSVLAMDPRHAPALNYLGYMFAERGVRLDEAVQLLQQAVQIDPHNGSYLDSLGWAYFKQKKLDLARTHLTRAAGQLVTNSVVQDHLGDLLFAMHQPDEAIAAWRRALAGDGEAIEPTVIEAKIQRARER